MGMQALKWAVDCKNLLALASPKGRLWELALLSICRRFWSEFTRTKFTRAGYKPLRELVFRFCQIWDLEYEYKFKKFKKLVLHLLSVCPTFHHILGRLFQVLLFQLLFVLDPHCIKKNKNKQKQKQINKQTKQTFQSRLQHSALDLWNTLEMMLFTKTT